MKADDNDNQPSFEDVTEERLRPLLSNATKWMAAAKEDFIRSETEEQRIDAANRLLKWTLSAAAQAVGPEAMRLVYGTAVYDDRKVALLRAWHRLLMVENLFLYVDQEGDLGSFPSLREELHAIANDDEPRLFARPDGGGTGTRRDTFRLAPLRLRALGWEAFLRGNGLRAGQAQSKVAEGYNRTWEAIRGWRKMCENVLGQENVASFLQRATDGTDWHYSLSAQEHGMEGAITTDGRALLEEERANASG